MGNSLSGQSLSPETPATHSVTGSQVSTCHFDKGSAIAEAKPQSFPVISPDAARHCEASKTLTEQINRGVHPGPDLILVGATHW
jgi:hypothetical protein